MAWQPVQVNPKMRRQILQSGDKSMLVRVEFEPGAVAAVHSHPHEQLTYVASGSIHLSVAGVERTLRAGESILLRGHIPHGVTTTEAAVLLDTFTPPREDFLASDPRQS
jgi:quercetin dioxygenase-like cupin family protein